MRENERKQEREGQREGEGETERERTCALFMNSVRFPYLRFLIPGGRGASPSVSK